MRRRSDLAKVWPLLRRLVISQAVSQNGGFCALLPSSSIRKWHRVPGAVMMTQRLQSLHSYNGENSRFQYLDVSGQTIKRVKRGATERPWKDTLLSSPGAISTDSETEYLFIADTHHHRIIIANGDGRVLDCIGSSPGMEDGTFETAQLCYPASTIFDANQNFLYIADSENRVIRRADLSRRTLGTIYPPKVGNGEISLWRRLLRWIGSFEQSKSEHEEGKAEQSDILRYPWHLKFTQHGLLLIASRCFGSIWVLDSNSGEVTEFQSQGSETVLEAFLSKAIDVKEMEDVHTLILHAVKEKESTIGNPWQIFSVIDIVSRVARLHNSLFFVDTEGHRIRRYDLETGRHESLHLSNLSLLGLPWWWSLSSPNLRSTSCISQGGNLIESIRQEADKFYHQIHIPPGRCLLCINPVLPNGMVWAARLEDGSIWRQARGSVVELSMFGGSLISQKISSAQQWLDDLDDLDGPDSDTEETEELTYPQQSNTGIPFYSLVDASLGAGEVTIDAVLYLKYAASQIQREGSMGSVKGTEKQIVSHERVVHEEGQIFLKHLQVKVRIEISASAPEERTKHITVQL